MAPKQKPAQAVGVDRMRGVAPPELLPPFDDTLPSGLRMIWRMPDIPRVLTFSGVIPDPMTAAVITLLREEKAMTNEFDPLKFRYDAQGAIGLYALAAEMAVCPAIDAAVEYSDKENTLGRCEIGYLDICQMYWWFRVARRRPSKVIAYPDGLEQPAMASPDSDGVPNDASGADGDN